MNRWIAAIPLSISAAWCAHADAAAPGASPACPDASRIRWTIDDGKVPAGLRCLVGSSSLVLVGELHGTREIPAWVGQLISQQSPHRPVMLVLERVTTESDAVQAFVHGGDEAATRNRMLAAESWSKEMSDGRSSAAIVGLLERMRALRQQGRQVDVVLAVRPPKGRAEIEAAGGFQAYGDQSIADTLRHALTSGVKNTLVIGYMGSAHALPSQDKAAAHGGAVSDRLVDLKPLVLYASGNGKAWNCTTDGCGAHRSEISTRSMTPSPGVDVRHLDFESFTASPPAVMH